MLTKDNFAKEIEGLLWESYIFRDAKKRLERKLNERIFIAVNVGLMKDWMNWDDGKAHINEVWREIEEEVSEKKGS